MLAAGAVGEGILRTAIAEQSELIIMDSYGFSPMLEVMLGSSVDDMLNEAEGPGWRPLCVVPLVASAPEGNERDHADRRSAAETGRAGGCTAS